MRRNSRLSLALHALSHMAYDTEEAHTSADIADHAGTNPVVVRRVLGKLRAAGLLTSERGLLGDGDCTAYHFGRRIRGACGEPCCIGIAHRKQTCAVERALDARVRQITHEIEQSLVERLEQTTIADVQSATQHEFSHAN